MNCRDFSERLAEMLDVDLDSVEHAELLNHAERCPQCALELEQERALLAALRPSLDVTASLGLKEKVMSKVREIERDQDIPKPNLHMNTAMRFALAGLTLIGMLLVGSFLIPHTNVDNSAGLVVLAQAAESVSSVQTMQMNANMRALPGDPFDSFTPDAQPIPITIWREYGRAPRWRVEKLERVAVMDGSGIQVMLKPDGGLPIVYSVERAWSILGWMDSLLDVRSLFLKEQEIAKINHNRIIVDHATDASGRELVVLTISARAKGDFRESDFRKNTSLPESDSTRVYTFDESTERLVNMEIRVHTSSGDISVFKTTSIKYGLPFSPEVFRLQIPDNAIRYMPPSGPDNSRLTPRQAAETILTSMSQGDWSILRGFAGNLFDDPRLRKIVGGLRIVSIGKPFKSGLYPGWFVPYVVHLASGERKAYNLAVRNDNPEKRWMLDGGF